MKLTDQPFLRFILRSHIFVSLCATGLSMETAIVLGHDFRPVWFYTLIFFATLLAYNLYYFSSANFKYNRLFMLSGLAGVSISWCISDHFPYTDIIMVSLLYALYILPVYFRTGRHPYYSWIKLFILVLVWTVITFSMPADRIAMDFITICFLLYRITFLSSLCILFFIRDELQDHFQGYARIAYLVTNLLQILISVTIMISGQAVIGLIYLGISLLMFRNFQDHRIRHYTDLDYLFFIDGQMLLESIFVSLYYLFIYES